MSFFRSEEHLARWLEQTNRQRGAVVPLRQVWALAKAWYRDPRDRLWHQRTRDQSQQVLSAAGLTGDFWELPPA